MTQKTSAFVFASGASVQVTSSTSTSTDATLRGSGGPDFGQVDGHVTISVNGVSLEATYHLEPEGLSVVVRGFDGADPNSMRLHDRWLFKPGERRVITVRRAHGQPPVHFTITRVGDGVQIVSDDNR